MKNADVDRVFDLGRELGVLEGQKKGIEERIREIKRQRDALLGRTSARASSAGRADSTNSLVGQILDVLNASPEKVFTWEEVADAIGSEKTSTVRSTLARLFKEHRIQRVSRGRYAGRQT